MIVPSHFEDAIFNETSSPVDEYFERNAPYIFEKDTTRAKVEVRCLSFLDLSSFDKVHAVSENCASRSESESLPLRVQVIDLNLERLEPFFRVRRWCCNMHKPMAPFGMN
jgi:hypothetical protein